MAKGGTKASKGAGAGAGAKQSGADFGAAVASVSTLFGKTNEQREKTKSLLKLTILVLACAMGE